ncbi:phytoene desaturase family protein [Fictibacillus norfolkensis]|uniref:phytoene desaturase family protein n=1 Tax=Fictibacillus norfolkensis TaxID=2762233 RepID=UPI00296AB5E1|nr:FAD-dependent oxidoreductase [Fictibacillus norfolkensis]
MKNFYDNVVIGGGLTGLTGAVYLSKAGKSVLVIEKERQLGGLARTTKVNGAYFNLGPHAMYEGGAALEILRDLECVPRGGYASKKGMSGIYGNQVIHVPKNLSLEESQEWMKVMGTLSEVKTDSLYSVSIREWAEKNIDYERVRDLFYAMCRQWSYCMDLSEISSGFVIEQGKLAAKGVRYVEGGWQKVVNDLRKKAEHFGATISTGIRAEQIHLKEDAVKGVILSNEKFVQANSVITAIGPTELCELVQGYEHMSIGKWKEMSHPLYGSCLDVALRKVPDPTCVFALSLDEPFYFSNHSVSVQLSDDGSHVLHVMKYNGSNNLSEVEMDERRLRELLNLLQPGWENEVVAVRFLPNQLIAYDSRSVMNHGVGIAPGPIVPEIRGLFVAGDWVGRRGRLADAAMDSAREAAKDAINFN